MRESSHNAGSSVLPGLLGTILMCDPQKVHLCVGTVQRTDHQAPYEGGVDGAAVIVVINFPEKRIGSVMSQCSVTGFADPNGDIVLAALERPVPNGTRLC